MVHHVVAEAFLGPKPQGAHVCHRNDIPADNRPKNLYYGDISSNLRDAYRNGGRCTRGERNGNAKLTREQVESIRQRYSASGITQAQLAREHGVSHHAVFAIVRNLAWRPRRIQ